MIIQWIIYLASLVVVSVVTNNRDQSGALEQGSAELGMVLSSAAWAAAQGPHALGQQGDLQSQGEEGTDAAGPFSFSPEPTPEDM